MIKTPDNLLFYDTETTGLWPWMTLRRKQLRCAPDRPFMFQVSNMDGDAAYFRGSVNPFTREVTYDNCKSEMRWLRDRVQDPKMQIVGHNLGFEQRLTRQADIGWDWRAQLHDTKVMWRLVVCDEMTYGLKPLAKKHFDFPDEDEKVLKKATAAARRRAKKKGWMIATPETHPKNPNYADYWLPELKELVASYGLTDPIRCTLLYRRAVEHFNDNPGIWDVYRWEQRLLRTCQNMERAGMTYLRRDAQVLMQFYKDYMKEQRRKIIDLGYKNLNWQSPKQLVKVFIEEKGYHTEHVTKGGKSGVQNPKIDAEQLMAWARGSNAGADVDGDGPDGCALSRAGLEWKAGKKVIEYLESYEHFLARRLDGSYVLRPAWDQAGARTGRFSCHDPNLMQIASAETSRRHANMRARQREAFGPRPEYYWYMPDYSQIEVWVFAFVANEKAMIKALLSGSDFHLATAHAAWGHRPDFCTCGRWKTMQKEHRDTGKTVISWDIEKHKHKKGCLIKWWRQRAKMILFSRLYGGGIGKVAFLIRCSLAEAEEFVDEFNKNLPGVKDYMERTIEEVRETGLLTNLFGRQYEIEKRFAYKAVNYMVQGSSADILKRALVRIDEYLRANYERSFLIGNVHDEILTEVHRDEHSAFLMRKIVKMMQADSKFIPNLPVPLPVGFKITSTSWNDAKEVTFLKRSA